MPSDLAEEEKKQSKKRRRKRKRIIGFCGQVVPRGDVRETGTLYLTWGGLEVEVPLASVTKFDTRYRYICAQWVVAAEKGEEILYPVKRAEEGELDPEVRSLMQEHCVMVEEGKEWLCTEPFFDKLYEKLKEYFGVKD